MTCIYLTAGFLAQLKGCTPCSVQRAIRAKRLKAITVVGPKNAKFYAIAEKHAEHWAPMPVGYPKGLKRRKATRPKSSLTEPKRIISDSLLTRDI